MITTHVLDTAIGKPAVAMAIVLEIHRLGEWVRLSSGRTDERGRLAAIGEGVPISPGVYRLTFDTGSYQRSRDLKPFFPEVQVVFTVRESEEHLHVPLLISPYGYSTYRGA